MQVQYDFFISEEESELIALSKLIREVKTSADKVRKGTYARLNEQTKMINDLTLRLEIIERNICKKDKE